jgi:hypothetical protein
LYGAAGDGDQRWHATRECKGRSTGAAAHPSRELPTESVLWFWTRVVVWTPLDAAAREVTNLLHIRLEEVLLVVNPFKEVIYEIFEEVLVR